jgi:hypothetical protein
MNLRSLAGCVVLAACLAGCGGGCSKSGDGANAIGAESALVEVLENGTVAWRVGADGKIVAEVTDKEGKPASKDASGTVTWKSESGEPGSAKLAYDADAKALVGAGPAPKADFTELKYDITAKPGALTGVLQVPVGGTAALVADAKAAEKEKLAADATGPNGGVVQVVGDDRVEILADDESDEVRVYVLDANGKAASVGSRKITLAVNADADEVIVLTPSADGLFLTGHWKAKSDPSRITVVVHKDGQPRVAIVGWKPGTKLLVAGGPKVKVKKHGLGWGAGGKPAELRGKEGAGVTPNGVVKIDFKGDKDKKDKDDDHHEGKGGGRGDGHGNGHGNGKGKGGGKGK